MKELLLRNLQGRKVLILFIVTNIIYLLMLEITIPDVMAFSGGMKLLDMMPAGYSPTYVNSLLNALGEEGRHAYLFSQIPLDMVYPFLFAITYCLVIAFFLNKLNKLQSPYWYFCLLPIFAGIFDYFENFGIITILNAYPNNSMFLSRITNVFSVLKSVFTSVFFILLIITLGFYIIKKIQDQKK